MRNQAKWLKLTVLLLMLAAPQVAYLQGEYGDFCSSNEDCVSKDFKNPLICIPIDTSPPTEQPVTTQENPISTTPEEPESTTEYSIPTDEVTSISEESRSTTDEHSTEDPSSSTEQSTLSTDPGGSGNDDFRNLNLGVCGCEPSMIRQEEFNRCVSPPLGHCHLQPENLKQKTCTKFAQCYPQSPDNNTGICYCESDAVEVPSLECKLTYGSDKCEKASDCNIYSDLTCNNGTCVCKSEESQRWSEEHNTCVNVAGASCRKSPPLPDPLCVRNASCIDNICACDDGFIHAPDNECKLDYNQTCSSDSECLPPFTCSKDESHCLCPSNLLYFESTKKCHLPAGSVCNTSSSDVCTLASTCLSGTCRCNDGYEAAQDGSCNALYDSICTEEIPCLPDKFLNKCAANGQGVSSWCRCRDNYNYNSISKRCVGNIDQECSVREDCVGETICDLNKCACDRNLIPGRDKKSCYAAYGGICSNDDCHPDLNLKCSQQNVGNSVSLICNCTIPKDQIYDARQGDCVALVGKSCDISLEGKIVTCVENAACLIQNDQSKCSCNSGYVKDRNNQCVLSGSSFLVRPNEMTSLLIFFFLLKHII